MADTHDPVVSPRLYVAVLLALMGLLVLTVIASFVDLDKRFHGGYWNMSLAILIAMAKAILIILFFMHVKYSSRLIWPFASAAFIWLGILLTLTFTDYGTRTAPVVSGGSASRLATTDLPDFSNMDSAASPFGPKH